MILIFLERFGNSLGKVWEQFGKGLGTVWEKAMYLSLHVKIFGLSGFRLVSGVTDGGE